MKVHGFLIAFCLLVCCQGGNIKHRSEIRQAKPAKKLSTRIVGGTDANIDDYPYQASLQYNPSSWSHTCGACIISEDWLITAAHCVQGDTPSQLRIVAGTSKLSEASSGQMRMLSEIKVHPDYGSGDGLYPNDIAALKLESPLEFGGSIDKVALADSDTGDFANEMCSLSGWGRTVGGGPLPDVLQEVQMTVLSKSDCDAKWPNDINNGHICIGTSTDIGQNKSACHGDSGGPMSCPFEGTTYLAGVTSWGSATCSGNPNVYTRISYFREWIEQTTGV